jgi:hypothetical protein
MSVLTQQARSQHDNIILHIYHTASVSHQLDYIQTTYHTNTMEAYKIIVIVSCFNNLL